MRWVKRLVCILIWGVQGSLQARNLVDMVIFSYDRPLQLCALLESVEKYFSGVNLIWVIYRAGDKSLKQAYSTVAQMFSEVTFVSQGEQPQKDFKPLVCKSVYGSTAEYIIFAVDDIVATDYVDLNICVDALTKNDAYGFFLRLGKNITARDFGNIQQAHPWFKNLSEDVLAWQFYDGGLSWRYAHTVDMTIYEKKVIKGDLYSMYYTSPNTFEDVWSQKVPKMNVGLCFTESKIVNVPLNRV